MWKEITEARYDEMFNVIFPALMTSVGFLMGEPMDSDAAGATRYMAFAHIGHAFYEAREPMAVAAFRLVTAAEVLDSCEGCGETGRHLFDCVNSDGT